jgi:hypothetical protein
VFIKSTDTGFEGYYGTTDDKGQLQVYAPPFWYTRGTYALVIDTGNTRVGTFWGYVLGFMTPIMLVIHIKRVTTEPIEGEIEYPKYIDTGNSNFWLFVGAAVAVIVIGGYMVFDYLEDWLKRRNTNNGSHGYG